MLHHCSFAVTDLDAAKAFYTPTLAALGYVPVWQTDTAIGYGVPGGEDQFALKFRPPEIRVPGDGFHLAFRASSPAAVDAFYRAALAHGGTDNGGCGLHPEYGPHYYAAFVLDPEGYQIEAVINTPPLAE